MRDNDGRKLDHGTLEVLRLRAVEQVEAGVHPEAVAEVLGLHHKTVYGWLATYREGGKDALRARPGPGPPTKLSGEQVRRIDALVVGADPRQLVVRVRVVDPTDDPGTASPRVRCGLGVVSVGRLLRTLGLSPQRPLGRASQQDPDAVARWKAETYPALRPEAAQVGATIYFLDEAGVRSEDHAGTTWAPVGQTPAVATTGTRHTTNLISAVTAQGVLRFAAYHGTLTAATFVDFCPRLLHDATGPVFLIVDGHPVHRSNAVKTFTAGADGRLRLLFLPAYSPQLNPDEWVWTNVKADRIGRAGIITADDLKNKALAALHRLQKLSQLIRGFFTDPNLGYVTANI